MNNDLIEQFSHFAVVCNIDNHSINILKWTPYVEL